ncbi:c-type cytochrome [Burkholderia pseudomultivorans]|uniref:Nicotinate dehydrogenase subunit B n=1 Tax=Burkholderia pseudomultivorans TaxID=1207504 RepID=A0ABU2E0L3_9BURK|nr:Nicotinate dehydrogenase subunit B [Burkholderia pseudomultivorans]MDR8732536.1 Nicotinate dehydrogenase subunit B [Burkholderia pseudomultivorans]MDR8739402.1 Nicotinate dehydrogenase subunit B [Burkholderia pseudomultivorans]MDR8753402.1 Nicotinate dehydrogenase subunit B [Burkholderia pseudomultivorans]MDR8775370.1 Nicotinate dehydrogenase subunit B [Burkholderia pseudomultivorans]
MRDDRQMAVQADAPLATDNAPQDRDDASRTHHARYSWPAGEARTHASLDIETRIAPDGRITAWRYRAQLGAEQDDRDVLRLRLPSDDGARDRDDDPSSDAVPGAGASAAAPPFVYRHAQTSIEMAAAAAAIPLHAHVFARESFVDELAGALRRDPVALRLQHLDASEDTGPREIIRMVSERAAWGAPGTAGRPAGARLSGRGFAFDGARAPSSSGTIAVPATRADESAQPGIVATHDRHHEQPNADATHDSGDANWSAWVVDLDVDRATGEVAVRRVVAGQGVGAPDQASLAGLPAWQIEAAISRVMGTRLAARRAHDETDTAARPDAFAHELIFAGDARPDARDQRSAHDAHRIEQAAAPAAAAIANALYDATGVRFRAPPFDPERIRAALAHPESAGFGDEPAAVAPRRASRWRRWLAGGGIGGMAGGLIGLACAILSGPAPIAPVAPGGADAAMWSAATLERGRQIAIAGDCAVCHTAPGGAPNAGGLALDTPFGTIYTTNLTPDPETGIGAWSYPAFARAMREGIGRDGTHLYPAFPYTAFAKLSEPDLLALYAYLMSQPPVKHVPPKTKLPFPLDRRRLLAGWNWLFHDARPFTPDPSRSAAWNRGKYLVDGAGHCGACHTPRNALGAEKGGRAYLSGGEAEGWVAPPLVASRTAPVPWTEPALFEYLRTGFSAQHGVAAGPMAPVVAGLASLPASDVRAIAHYLSSLSPPVDAAAAADAAARHARGAEAVATLGLENGRRAFDAACAVCHAESGGVGHFGVRPLMGLNTSVSQATPDNLLRVLHNGIDHPATERLGYMPGFRDAFDDRQMAELAAYIRARYAPGQPAWRNLADASARIRQEGVH